MVGLLTGGPSYRDGSPISSCRFVSVPFVHTRVVGGSVNNFAVNLRSHTDDACADKIMGLTCYLWAHSASRKCAPYQVVADMLAASPNRQLRPISQCLDHQTHFSLPYTERRAPMTRSARFPGRSYSLAFTRLSTRKGTLLSDAISLWHWQMLLGCGLPIE